MSTAVTPIWHPMRTDETRHIEELLRQYFAQADAYRYNSATIRVRVVDPTFENLDRERRDSAVERHIDTLPIETQRDIITLLTFAPSELESASRGLRGWLMNTEFEDPSPSTL